MKVTLKNGKTMDVVSVEENYSPHNGRGVMLSIRADSDETVEALSGMFTADAVSEIHVENGGNDLVFAGYTVLDSVRKFYDGETQANTIIDLAKEGK